MLCGATEVIPYSLKQLILKKAVLDQETGDSFEQLIVSLDNLSILIDELRL